MLEHEPLSAGPAEGMGHYDAPRDAGASSSGVAVADAGAFSSGVAVADAGASGVAVASRDAEQRAVADQITEDVLQLLYTAHQDLAELGADGGAVDAGLLQSAQECTLGAISILRVVASTVLATGAGAAAPTEGRGGWEETAAVLFDGMSDAWIVTCEARDLLFASEAACTLLGRGAAELADLMHEKHGWPTIVAGLPRTRGSAGQTHFDLEVPLPAGGLRTIHVESYALPAVEGVRRSYISLLTER